MKALLIDDHPMILSAMQAVMSRMDMGWEVRGVETASEGRALLAADPGIDLVLLDLLLGDADGFELLAELRAAYPALPVVVVSASEQSQDVTRALGIGALGYVPKRASNELLSEALHLVMSGGVYVPPMSQFGVPAMASEGLSALSRSAALDKRGDGAAWLGAQPVLPPQAPEPGPARVSLPHSALESLGLTGRQRQVLALLLQGKANKAIAAELGVSVETVKDHVAAVLRCLGVNSRTQAVLAVAQLDGGRGAAGLLRR